MKRGINFYRIFFVFLIFTLVSCEAEGLYLKEQHTKRESNKIIKKLRGEEAKRVYSLLEKNFSKSLTFSNSSNMRVENPLALIDYSNILLVIDSIGIKNYTFKIINHPDDNFKTFHNLVLTEKNNELKATIIQYEMTDMFAQEYNMGLKSFYEFQGKVKAETITPPTDEPCVPIQINYPSDPSGGGGSEGGGFSDSGPSSAGGGGSNCYYLEITFNCSCGRSYDTLTSYFSSICGNGQYPGYTLTIRYITYEYICRMSSPCGPDGDIGVIDPIKNNPCEELKKKSLQSAFKSRFITLNNPAHFDLDYETAFVETRDGNTQDFTYLESPPGENNHIDINTINNRISFIHVHVNDYSLIDNYGDQIPIKTAKIPSASDLSTFIQIQLKAYQLGVPISETYGMTLSSQALFSFKVKTSNYTEFANTVNSTGIDWKKFNKDCDYETKQILDNNSLNDVQKLTVMQKLILKMIKDYGLSSLIGLYQGTVTGSGATTAINWSEKILNDTNELDEIPCY